MGLWYGSYLWHGTEVISSPYASIAAFGAETKEEAKAKIIAYLLTFPSETKYYEVGQNPDKYYLRISKYNFI